MYLTHYYRNISVVALGSSRAGSCGILKPSACSTVEAWSLRACVRRKEAGAAMEGMARGLRPHSTARS